MKRLTIAFGLALVLAVGSAGRADAQVMYGYGVNPYNGTVRSNYSVVTPFSTATRTQVTCAWPLAKGALSLASTMYELVPEVT